MTIQLTKHAGKSPTLRCTRDDGSTTWQNYGTQGAFFPIHDLAHYAVETVLGYREGFFGMIARGRELGDFGPGDAAKMHPEAHYAEMLAGFLTTAEAGGCHMSFEEIVATIDTKLALEGIPAITLSREQLQQIRMVLKDLVERWKAVAEEGDLQLEF